MRWCDDRTDILSLEDFKWLSVCIWIWDSILESGVSISSTFYMIILILQVQRTPAETLFGRKIYFVHGSLKIQNPWLNLIN